MLSELEKAYLAGVMDSDGWFTIKRDTYAMRVRGDAGCPIFQERLGIKQVTPQAIDMLYKEFGGYRRIEKPSTRRGKPLYAWSVVCQKAVDVVYDLLPYLRIKRPQAETLLALHKFKMQPRQGHRISTHLDRWGNMTDFRQAVLSQEQILEREALYEQIKSLNDTRNTQARLI